MTGCNSQSIPIDSPAPSQSQGRPTPIPYPGPAEFGPAMPVLWQGAPWGDLAVANGLVLGVTGRSVEEVRAISALTGAPAWTVTIPPAEPDVLELVLGNRVVVVEVGHQLATPAGTAVVFENIALDIRTGKQLWTAPVPGRHQSPPIALTGDVVVGEGATGTVIARDALTGTVVWQRPRPAGCPAPSGDSFAPTIGLAADGPLLSASFQCQDGRVVVQRLAVSTGQTLWQWNSPGGGAPNLLLAVGAAQQGTLILLSGQIAPPDAAQRFVHSLPAPYTWPESLGPAGSLEVVLALDAVTGQPRWTEFGAQLEKFSLADGAVCESYITGFECRDDLTGAPSRPVLTTGRGEDSSPPYIGDGYAGISGSVAAVTVIPASQGHVAVVVVPIHAAAAIARTELPVGPGAYGGADYQTFVVAAGTLPDGATLLLLRRVDLAGYPVQALRFSAAAG